jgi:hypothetical protein
MFLETDHEPTLRLGLQKMANGSVVLVATNDPKDDPAKGQGYSVLLFRPDGTAFRIRSVPPDLGLLVDDCGRLKLINS